MEVVPHWEIIGKLSKLKKEIIKGSDIEATLWTLLETDKHEDLIDEHKQLKSIAFELSKEIPLIAKSQFEKELQHVYSPENKANFKNLILGLFELEELLIRQQKELLDLDKLSHNEIVAILNSNKKGKDISETSQKISEISNGITNLIDQIENNYYQERLLRMPKESKVKQFVA